MKSPFLTGLVDRQVVLAKKTRVMTQEDKIAVICDLALTRMYQTGACKFADLEADCEQAGLSGRIALQLGVGLGGKGGLQLHRDKDGDVTVDQNNALILARRLGDAGLIGWQQTVGMSDEQLQAWFDGLPAA